MIKSIVITKQNFLDYSDFAYKRLLKPEDKKNTGFLKNMIIWFLLTLFLIIILQMKNINFSNFHWQSSLITSIPFGIVFFVFFSNTKKYQRLSVPKENGITLGNKTIEFQAEGIKEINSFGYSFYQWGIVEAFEEHKGNIYIFIDKLIAIIIPAESFSSTAEKEQLKLLIQKHV